jgi:hypothetical protein
MDFMARRSRSQDALSMRHALSGTGDATKRGRGKAMPKYASVHG